MNAQHGLRHRRGGGRTVRRLPLLLILAVVAALLLPARLVQASSVWQTAPALPQALSALAATTGADGTLYAIGGTSSCCAFQSTVYSFKPGTDTSWQTAPSLPAARVELAATTGSDGTLYAIGGRDSSGNATSTVYSFKPGTDTSWQTAPSLPQALYSLAATTGSDGTLYAIGGDNNGHRQSTVYSFKPGTPLTITANNQTMSYGGTVPSFTAQYSGFVNNDTSAVVTGLTCGATDTNGHPVSSTTPVGTYAITCGGASASGYTITYVDGTFTITQATPQISWTNPADITYGTALSAKQLNATATSNGTSVAGTFVYTPAAGTVLRAGSGQTLAVSFTPTDTTDFTVPPTKSVTINVSKATLTVTPDNQTITYGQTPTYTFTVTGFANGDTAATAAGYVAPTCSAGAGPFTVPGSPYTISCTGGSADNYSFDDSATASLTVTKAALAVTAPSPTMTYGDTTLPSLAPSSSGVSGLQNGDTFSGLGGSCSVLTSSGTPVTLSSSTNAGSYTVRCAGVSTANYTVTYSDGLLNVNPAPLTITALDQHSAYGTTTADLTRNSNTIAYTGFVNGDTAASLTTPAQLHTTATKASPVGTYPITVDSATAANYTISFVPGTLHVDPAPLTITPNNLTMTYKGPVPASTWTATFVNGDTSASLTTQPTCVAKDGSGNPVSSSTVAGVYPITCTGAVDPNYTMSYATAKLTIVYGTTGYLQPVNDTAHGETCGSPCPMSIFKAGQTIPFKFQIKDANGNVVGPDANPVSFTATAAGTTSSPVDESLLTVTADTGTTFTWTGTMYQYNWKSPSQSGSLWLITATFANGQTIQVTIGLR